MDFWKKLHMLITRENIRLRSLPYAIILQEAILICILRKRMMEYMMYG